MNEDTHLQDHAPTNSVAKEAAPLGSGRSRRTLLFGGLAATVLALSAACSSDQAQKGTASDEGGGGDTDQEPDVVVNKGDVDGGRDPNNPTGATPSPELAEDLDMAGAAAGLEFLAVTTYQRALTAAGAGRLGAVPPAVKEFMTTVMGHHQAALDQWNRALAISGKPEVAASDPDLQATVDSTFASVKDVVAAARLALMLEDIASATYLAAIPKLKAPESIALAASIQPVDMQHAAVLHFVLGEYPVPDVFATTTLAVTPA